MTSRFCPLTDFVRAGSGLVATELTSLYDEWRRLRTRLCPARPVRQNALLDLGDFWQN